MNIVQKTLIKSKLKKEDRPIFKEICLNIETLEHLESKLPEKDKRSLSMAYLGVSYELFLIGLNDLAIKYFRKFDPSNYSSLVDMMYESEFQLAVNLVVYYNIKDVKEFNENYFFKIFQETLKNTDFKFPTNPRVYFPEFLEAWNNTFSKKIIILNKTE